MKADRRARYAELVSTVLGPVPTGVFLGVAVGICSGAGLVAGAGWGLLSVVAAAVLPAIATAPLRRREARTPRTRLVYMTPAVLGALVGLISLWLLSAPPDVRILALGFAVGLICSTSINSLYPSSNHVAAVAGGAVLAGALLTPWATLSLVAVPLQAWSRVAMGRHTPAQVLVGAAVGLTSATLVVVLST